MNIKEYLKQAPELDDYIMSLLDQSEQLQSLAEKTTTTLTHMPKAKDNKNRMEYCVDRLCELEEEIYQQMDKYISLRKEIRELISKIENTQYQRILEVRYLNRWGWDKIAEDMNYEVRQVYRIHGQALYEAGRIMKTCQSMSVKSVI